MSKELRTKPESALRWQVDAVSAATGAIVPPSVGDEVYAGSQRQLQAAYPVRWGIYTDHLHTRIRDEHLGQQPTSASEHTRKKIHLLNRLDASRGRLNEERTTSHLSDAIAALSDGLEKGHFTSGGYFELPPHMLPEIYTEIAKITDLKTLIVTPTIYAADRAWSLLTDNSEQIDIGRLYGPYKEPARTIEIVTYTGLRRELGKGTIDPREIDVLLLDGVHLALTPRRREAIERFDNALVLGFTPTPTYSEEKKVPDMLPERVMRYKIKEAAKEGKLAEFSVYEVQTAIDLTKVRIQANGDYNENDLRRAVDTERRNKAVVEVYQRPKFAGKAAITYCAGIAHAEALVAEFTQAGVSAEVIHGGMSTAEQREIRQRFKTGATKVICNADLLVTNFDEPVAEVCFNARPTLSEVMASNRGSQVLLLDENNPKKHAYIVDFIDEDNRQAFSPVRYAEVVEGTAFGLVVNFGESRSQPRLPHDFILDLDIGEISIDVREVLSVFDDLVRDDTETTTVQIPIDVLIGLVDKAPGIIAEQLPLYFQGVRKRVKEAAQAPAEQLRTFRAGEKKTTELPTIVVERMLLDSMYESVFARDITAEMPAVVTQLANLLTGDIPEFPEIQGHLRQLQQIKEFYEAADVDRSDKLLANQFLYRLSLLEQDLRGAFLKTTDIRSREVNQALQQARQVIGSYKTDEVGTVRQRRLKRLLKKQPADVVAHVVSTGEREVSRLFDRAEGMEDKADIKRTIDTTTATVLMDKHVPANLIGTSEQLIAAVDSLPGELLPPLYRAYSQEVASLRALDQRTLNAAVDVHYANLQRHITTLFAAITRTIDGMTGRPTGMPASQRDALITARNFLATMRNNTRIVQAEVVKTLGDDPDQVTQVRSAVRVRANTERTNLVRKLQANSLLIQHTNS